MNRLISIFVALILISPIQYAQEDRKVLVEVFTNTFCEHCPAAHNVIDNYVANSPNGDKITYIYFHMSYPYTGDPFYAQSMQGSDARDAYYNPVQATPQAWFDGVHQGGTSGWASTLDNLTQGSSPLIIELSGNTNTSEVNINARLSRIGNISDNDLVIHFVVVENSYYVASNGIDDHFHVLKRMFPTPSGLSFSINPSETKNIEQDVTLNSQWDNDSLNFVVFVQSVASKTVYQSETISYSDLVVTRVDDDELIPIRFVLEQNYPNPFNPSTIINFSIPTSSFVSLKIFDVLGKEVATLLYEEKNAGSYKVNFDGKDLTNGIYFYKLQTENFVEIKKMVLIK